MSIQLWPCVANSLFRQIDRKSPALVARDADGKAYTVRYDAVNAMVLNEFLKEHKTVAGAGSDGCAAAKANCSAYCGPTESERTA